MFEWLTPLWTEVDPTLATLSTLLIRLVLAWLSGLAVAAIAKRGTTGAADKSLTLTLVLMSILIAMATQIIGDNIARAFSLVGALSIVRFRTAVPATRDMAFVLAAVVVGMAAGAGQYWVCGLGLLIVALATWLGVSAVSPRCANDSAMGEEASWELSMQVGLHGQSEWEAELIRLTQSRNLLAAETVRRGGALELVYRYTPKEDVDASQLVAALHALPTIESVSAKKLSGAGR